MTQMGSVIDIRIGSQAYTSWGWGGETEIMYAKIRVLRVLIEVIEYASIEYDYFG